MTTYGGPMPEDFVDGEVLTANDFNRVKNYWVSSTFPDAAVSASAQDGDVVFVLDNADTVPNTLVALWDTDINIETLDTGEALVYDATSGMWTNTQVDVSSEIATLQSQIDYNTAAINSHSTSIANNSTSISANTTNISNLSGTVSSLSTTVDAHTTQITALEEGGGGGGGSATLWSGTVTAVMNGDQQTIEVAAGDPINATIIAANKARGFCYIGDKVVGGTVDGGYAIISREFNYPDMPAFDPTGGLTTNGADNAKFRGSRLYYSFAGHQNTHAVIANYDPFAGDCYWNLSLSSAYYASIGDSSFYGSMVLPEAMNDPISYNKYAIFPARGDNKTCRVWYWDYNVQDLGELTGLNEAVNAKIADYVAIDANWETAVSENTILYDTMPYLDINGKLNVIASVSQVRNDSRQIKMHFIYEYSIDPLSGTWTLQREREVMARNYVNLNKVAYDNTGMFFGYRAGNTGGNISWTWWNWENDTLTFLASTGEFKPFEYGGNTILPKNSNRPYTTGDINEDNGVTLQIKFFDFKNWSENTIELTSFPLTEYRTWIGTSVPKSTMMMDGYIVAALVNKTTNKFEFWKFDLYGQATKIADGLYDGVYDSYNSGYNRYNLSSAGDFSSPTIGFKISEDTTQDHDGAGSSYTYHRLYWIDTSA